MRVVKQGKTVIGNTQTQLITPAVYNGRSKKIWVGVGGVPAAMGYNQGEVRIGIAGSGTAAPQRFLDTVNKHGFIIEHDAPNDIYVTGTAGDVVCWEITSD